MSCPELVRTAPPLRGPVIFDQQWLDLCFLHWPVDPRAIARLFPAGSRPDVIDGVSYVGLVPFRMQGAGPGSGLPVAYFGTFAETNVRLYSIDEAGRRGIVFCSLETQRLAIVALTRSGLGLPYTWAAMSATRYGDVYTYQSTRRLPRRGLRSTVSVRVGEPVVATPVEEWLTARWGLHTRVLGRTLWLPNEHSSWPLCAAEPIEVEDELVAAAGVVTSGRMLRPLFSPGVRTRFGMPVTVC